MVNAVVMVNAVEPFFLFYVTNVSIYSSTQTQNSTLIKEYYKIYKYTLSYSLCLYKDHFTSVTGYVSTCSTGTMVYSVELLDTLLMLMSCIILFKYILYTL